MAEFASKGVAGSGLGLGIAGTALGLLNSNLLGLNGRNGNATADININAPDVEVARFPGRVWAHGCGYGGYVSHYELGLNQKINEKDAIITGQQAQLYTNQEVSKLREEFNCFKQETANRFCYDEKLIAENKCEIEKTNINIKDNYYKMDKVIRPWDICPPVQLACPPTPTTELAAKKTTSNN